MFKIFGILLAQNPDKLYLCCMETMGGRISIIEMGQNQNKH